MADTKISQLPSGTASATDEIPATQTGPVTRKITGQGLADLKTWTNLAGKPATFPPSTHASSHQDGGSDEINVTGLSGLLADPQTVANGDKGDITVTAGGTAWTIDDNAVTFAKLQDITAQRLLGRGAGSGDPEELIIGGGIEFGGASPNYIRLSAFTGDVTKFTDSTVLTIANDAVTYAKMQNVVNNNRFIGRISGANGDPEELTGTQATTLLDTFTSSLKGLAPVSGGGTTNFLRADGTWAAPPGGGADPWTYVKVTGSDFTTTSASAVDVTGLFFLPATNLSSEFEAVLMIRTATTTVNPRIGLAWPTGMTDGVAQIIESQAATGTPLFASGNINAALLIAVGGLPNTTQSWPVTIKGMVRAGGLPGSSLRVQLASETAGTTVQVQIGSFLRYRIIP